MFFNNACYKSIMHTLECPICNNYMHPPIRQCQQGHSVCDSCYSKVDRCPTCRESKSEARSWSLEHLHGYLFFPCKNKDDGCNIVCIGEYIQKHEDSCIYTRIECPFNTMSACEWTGDIGKIIVHCFNKHRELVHEKSEETITHKNFFSSNMVRTNFYRMFYVYDQTFKLSYYMDEETKIVQWCVLFLGPVELCERYFYSLKFENKTSKKLKFQAPCEPMKSESQTKRILIHYDMIKPYCSNNNLTFNIKISDKCSER